MVLFYLAGKLSLNTSDVDCQVALQITRTLQENLRVKGFPVDECLSERDSDCKYRYLSDKSEFIDRKVFSGGDYEMLFVDGKEPDVELDEEKNCYVFTAKGAPDKQYSIGVGSTAYVTMGNYADRARCAAALTAMISESSTVFNASDPVLDEFRAILRCAAAWTLEKDRCNEEIAVVALGTTSGYCAVFNSLVHLTREISSTASSRAVTAVFKSSKGYREGRLGSQVGIELSYLLTQCFS